MIKLDIEANTFEELIRQVEGTLGVKIDLANDARLPLDSELPKQTVDASSGIHSGNPSAEKTKRTRRTKAEIEAAKATETQAQAPEAEEVEEKSVIDTSTLAAPAANKVVYSLADCKSILKQVLKDDESGMPEAAHLHSSFGIKSLNTLDPKQYPFYIKAAQEILDGRT